MEEEVNDQIPCVQASAIRLVDFWDSNPKAWLSFVESQFRQAGIKNEQTKFDAVVEKLPQSIITKLTSLIAKPPKEEPYMKLCSELIKLVSLSDREKYQTLMHRLEIGDSKPSELYQRMKQLLYDENIDTFFYRQIFLQKLPPVIQRFIAVMCPPDAPMDQLVDKADDAYVIYSNYKTISTLSSSQVPVLSTSSPSFQSIDDRFAEIKKEIAEIRSALEHLSSKECSRNGRNPRSPSPRRRYKKATHDICFYHVNFGTAARKCQPPCKFS